MDLKAKSVDELKVLWYDQFVVKRIAENNLDAINQELEIRANTPPSEEEPDGND